MYTDTYDIAFGSSWDLPDLLWLLTNINGVHIDSVKVSSHVTDSTRMLKMTGLQQRRGGQWVTVGKGHPVQARAGHPVTLRLVFAGGSTGKKFTVAVPAKAQGMHARLYANPAESYPFERSLPHRLAGVKKLVDHMQRNDQAQVLFSAFGGRHSVNRTTLTQPEGTVIDGRAAVTVVVS
jgi:hypothetical protein